MRWLALPLCVTTAWAADVAHGRRLFDSQCALCHGIEGKGGRGPVLATPKLKSAPDEAALKRVISQGIENTEMPGAWQLNPREVDNVTAYVQSLGKLSGEPATGNPARGVEVYRAKACASCHTVAGSGGGFGPELTGIGARRSVPYLRESLVKPAAAAPDYFLYVEAVPAAGSPVRGIRVNEDSFTIHIKDTSENFHAFRKSDLKALRKLFDDSPMPSYEKSLSTTELNDLVAYLASLKGKQ